MYDIVYNFRHLEFFEMMRNADEKQLATSNQKASNKKKNHLNIYPRPGMSHYIPCTIAE
jgi:hypothetical protein